MILGDHLDLLAACGTAASLNTLAGELDAAVRPAPSATMLARAAHYYATIGLHVFPLTPGAKKPLIPSAHPVKRGIARHEDLAAIAADPVCHGECGKLGHGLHDATTDTDLVASWWARSPQANIGLRTGITFDVIDIDGVEGYDSLATLTDSGIIPATFGRAITPRGGAHLFIKPTGAGNGASLGPGIDYRGDGGYVVAAPSISTDTGRRWRWITNLDIDALKASTA